MGADRQGNGNSDGVKQATGVVMSLVQSAKMHGHDGPNVLSYTDVLKGTDPGKNVLIVGTGGIGHDVAAYLLLDDQESNSVEKFAVAWGVDTKLATPGGLVPMHKSKTPRHHITLLQRSVGRSSERLGKSTGWILKAKLRQAGVKMVTGVQLNGSMHEACIAASMVSPSSWKETASSSAPDKFLNARC